MKKEEMVKKYKLAPLPWEGGYFRQVHKSEDIFLVSKERYGDDRRSSSTSEGSDPKRVRPLF